jgi:hypothetical protein
MKPPRYQVQYTNKYDRSKAVHASEPVEDLHSAIQIAMTIHRSAKTIVILKEASGINEGKFFTHRIIK